jgi:predicted  nucleic acid-binding Zn-ribbon protein
MKEILGALLRLQASEFGEIEEKLSKSEVAALRATVPPPILGHYDRLVVRGKKGVAIVRNQTCTGCHMRIPIGTINTLMQGADIQLCDTCGRYLHLPEQTEVPAVEPAQPARPACKPRRRKGSASRV